MVMSIVAIAKLNLIVKTSRVKMSIIIIKHLKLTPLVASRQLATIRLQETEMRLEEQIKRKRSGESERIRRVRRTQTNCSTIWTLINWSILSTMGCLKRRISKNRPCKVNDKLKIRLLLLSNEKTKLWRRIKMRQKPVVKKWMRLKGRNASKIRWMQKEVPKLIAKCQILRQVSHLRKKMQLLSRLGLNCDKKL